MSVGAMVLSLWVNQQQSRFGYAEFDQLVAGYGPATEIEQQIQVELAPMRQKLDEQRRATAVVETKIVNQKEHLSLTDLSVLQLQLVTAKQRQDEMGRQIKALEDNLQQIRMQPVYANLNRHMEQFGEANGYAMIWSADNANLVYADEAANITDDLLAWIATHNEDE